MGQRLSLPIEQVASTPGHANRQWLPGLDLGHAVALDHQVTAVSGLGVSKRLSAEVLHDQRFRRNLRVALPPLGQMFRTQPQGQRITRLHTLALHRHPQTPAPGQDHLNPISTDRRR